MRNSHSNRMNMAAGPGAQFCKLLLLTLWLATSVCLSGATEIKCTSSARDGSKTCLHNQKYMPHLIANQPDSGQTRTFQGDTEALRKLLKVAPEKEWTVEEKELDSIQDYSYNSHEHLSEESDFSGRDSEVTSKASQSGRKESQDHSEDYMYSEESQDYSKEDYSDDDIEEIEEHLSNRYKRGWMTPWAHRARRFQIIKHEDQEFQHKLKHVEEHQKEIDQQIASLEKQLTNIKAVEATQKLIEHQIEFLKKQLAESRTRREDHGPSRRDTFETRDNRNPTEIEGSEYSEEEYDFTDYTQDYSDNSREHLSEESDFSERDSEDYSKEDSQESQDSSEMSIKDIEEIEEYLSRRDKKRVYKRFTWIFNQRGEMDSKLASSLSSLQDNIQPVEDSQKKALEKMKSLEDHVPRIKSLNAAFKQAELHVESLEKQVAEQIKSLTRGKKRNSIQLADSRTTREDHGSSIKQQYSKPAQRRDTFEITDNRNPTEIEDSEYSEEEYDFTDYTQDYSNNSREHLSEESDFSERDSEDTSKASQSDREESQDHSEDYSEESRDYRKEDYSDDYIEEIEELLTSRDKRKEKKLNVLNHDTLKQLLVERNNELLEPMQDTQKELKHKMKSLEKEAAELFSVRGGQKEVERRIKSLKSQIVEIKSIKASQGHKIKVTQTPASKGKVSDPKQQIIKSLEEEFAKIKYVEAGVKQLHHDIKSLKQLAVSRSRRTTPDKPKIHGPSMSNIQNSVHGQRRDVNTLNSTGSRNQDYSEDYVYSMESWDNSKHDYSSEESRENLLKRYFALISFLVKTKANKALKEPTEVIEGTQKQSTKSSH